MQGVMLLLLNQSLEGGCSSKNSICTYVSWRWQALQHLRSLRVLTMIMWFVDNVNGCRFVPDDRRPTAECRRPFSTLRDVNEISK